MGIHHRIEIRVVDHVVDVAVDVVVHPACRNGAEVGVVGTRERRRAGGRRIGHETSPRNRSRAPSVSTAAPTIILWPARGRPTPRHPEHPPPTPPPLPPAP